MRWLLALALVAVAPLAVAVLPPALPAQADPWPRVTGNDTGGIIEWSPVIAHVYRRIAIEHCANWNRYARITSVHRRYGDFVGFACVTDRHYDPRKAWVYDHFH